MAQQNRIAKEHELQAGYGAHSLRSFLHQHEQARKAILDNARHFTESRVNVGHRADHREVDAQRHKGRQNVRHAPKDSTTHTNPRAGCISGQFSVRERIGLTFQQARDFARSFRLERAA